ncbi:MAG: hypothetical protein ACRDN6_07695, partial [Gaiellaceae bacterium]
DRPVAARVLTALVEELGGPPATDPPDLARIRAFLTQPATDVPIGDPHTSTRQWKTGFAQQERMRGLAGELAELL